MNERGQRIKIAEPSDPVQVLGFDQVPQSSDIFAVIENEKEILEKSNDFLETSGTSFQIRSEGYIWAPRALSSALAVAAPRGALARGHCAHRRCLSEASAFEQSLEAIGFV